MEQGITAETFKNIRIVYKKTKNSNTREDKDFFKFTSNQKDNKLYLSGEKGEEDEFAEWNKQEFRFIPTGAYASDESSLIICQYLTGLIGEKIKEPGEDNEGVELESDKVVEDVNRLFRKTATYLATTVF